jgi:hypothetical protein
VSTVVGLVTVMNEHIVATAPETTPNGLRVPPPVDPSFPWPLLLSVVKEVEVFVEMSSEHYLGKDKKWTPVATVEALKYHLPNPVCEIPLLSIFWCYPFFSDVLSKCYLVFFFFGNKLNKI